MPKLSCNDQLRQNKNSASNSFLSHVTLSLAKIGKGEIESEFEKGERDIKRECVYVLKLM